MASPFRRKVCNTLTETPSRERWRKAPTWARRDRDTGIAEGNPANVGAKRQRERVVTETPLDRHEQLFSGYDKRKPPNERVVSMVTADARFQCPCEPSTRDICVGHASVQR